MLRFFTSAIIATSLLGTLAIADPGGRQGPKDCPPGLRDKGCMPPGQAKKYELGAPLPDGYGILRDFGRYDLPAPPPGKAYAEIDGEIVIVDRDTKTVLDLVKVLDATVF